MMKIFVALLFALLFKADAIDPVYPCSDDVKLVYTIGTSEYDALPIKITAQDTKHVTFEVSNGWPIPLSNLFIEYHNPFTGRICVNNEDWNTENSILTLTAQCMETAPITVVYLVAMDSQLSNTNDNATVPLYCNYGGACDDEDSEATQLPFPPAVQYTFTLQCVPKNC
jgi:hypothetical protein